MRWSFDIKSCMERRLVGHPHSCRSSGDNKDVEGWFNVVVKFKNGDSNIAELNKRNQ